MNELKKTSWLVVSLVGLFLTYSAMANQNYGDWTINDDNPDIQIILLLKNEQGEMIRVMCSSSIYMTSIFLPNNIGVDGDAFFDYRIDNQSLILKGNNYFEHWLIPGIWYKDGQNQISGEIDKYRILFQQMLKAKESLTVNAIDEHGKIYHSISFSVKGLPEALIEFAKQCGTDFQTYSGIKINQSDNHNK